MGAKLFVMPDLSIEDMQIKTKVTKAVIETLKDVGVLNNLPESSQMSLF